MTVVSKSGVYSSKDGSTGMSGSRAISGPITLEHIKAGSTAKKEAEE
jgi:hypothetical protein